MNLNVIPRVKFIAFIKCIWKHFFLTLGKIEMVIQVMRMVQEMMTSIDH